MADISHSQVIVIDSGSGSIKAGAALLDAPPVEIPTLYGHAKYSPIASDGKDTLEFYGQDARDQRGLLTLQYPMVHGQVQDWSAMERLWNKTYSELQMPSYEHPVHLTEAPLNPRSQTEKLVSIFFEEFNVPAAHISVQAVLSLYTAGRTSGLALDCGDGVCHAVPMVEGFVVPSAVERSDIGGRDVTSYLRQLLRKSGTVFTTSAEMDIVREIKESKCAVNPKVQKSVWDIRKEMSSGLSVHRTPTVHFKLPDNTHVELGAERYWAPEVLFHPLLVGKEDLGVQDLVHVSLQRCPVDSRAALWSQIVVSGGSTCFQSFPDRLLEELRRHAASETRIRLSAPVNRKYSSFVGASVVASLSSFKKQWVTKKEYDEIGSHAVARKMSANH